MPVNPTPASDPLADVDKQIGWTTLRPVIQEILTHPENFDFNPLFHREDYNPYDHKDETQKCFDEGGPIIGCSVGERLFLRLEALLTSHLETVKEQLIEEIGEVQGDSDSSFDVALLGRYVEERERYHLATKINTDLLTLVSRGRLPRIPAQKNEKASRSIFEIPLLHSMLWKDVVLFGSDGIWEDLKFAAEKLVGVREGGKVVDESFAKKVVHAVEQDQPNNNLIIPQSVHCMLLRTDDTDEWRTEDEYKVLSQGAQSLSLDSRSSDVGSDSGAPLPSD